MGPFRLLSRLPVHVAWIVAAVTFVALLVSAGVRSMPGVLLAPLEEDLGWNRATTSFAVSVGIALYGLTGPFAAALMQKIGIRKTVVMALLLMSAAVALTTLTHEPWQMVLSWGVLSGLATGTVANVLGATVVTRWFVKKRGLAVGILTASVSTGQLLFLPAMAYAVELWGWRMSSLVVAGVALLIVPLIFLLMVDSPADIGSRPYGASEDWVAPQRRPGNPLGHAFGALWRGVHSPTFWLLFSSFFVCGLSTNGLIGTHMIALCLDHGIPEVKGAGLLAAMGLLDLVGTTASGWLSDRYDNRALLFWYYGLRGLSLVFLPFSDFSFFELSLFALFYGLDWIATVPPTVRLATQTFGDAEAPILFGWISAGHQLGAATAAFGAGFLRNEFDTYLQAFILSGLACVAVAIMMLGTYRRSRQPAVLPAE